VELIFHAFQKQICNYSVLTLTFFDAKNKLNHGLEVIAALI